MEREFGAEAGRPEYPGPGEYPPAPAGPGTGRAGSGGDALILAAEPSPDIVFTTSAYEAVRSRERSGGHTPERLALFLLRLLSGVLLGGATMLATTRWTHLDGAVVKDAFFGVMLAVMTLVAAAAGFYYGASVHMGGRDR